jgi:hypothetical protein
LVFYESEIVNDNASEKMWTIQFGSSVNAENPNSFERGYALTVDSSDNIYVTGETSGDLGGETNASVGSNDIFLVKYNSSGTKQWTKLLGTSDNDSAKGVATDSTGNVYVTGYTRGGLDGNTYMGGSWIGGDIFLVKYNSSGTKQWTKQLGTSSDDLASGVATDSSGNVYVTGYTAGGLDNNTNSGSDDIFLVKYNSSGTKQWTKQLGTDSQDRANGVVVDSSDNIYVTGRTGGALDGNTSFGYDSDIFLLKYSPNGTKHWTKQLGTSSGDNAFGVATDSSGNVYVTGETSGGLDGSNAGSTDIFLVKYNSSGTKQWTKQLGTSSVDWSEGVVTDSSGNVYVTGYTQGPLDGNSNAGVGEPDIFLVKYNSSGTKQWTKLLGTSSVDIATGVATDSSGNVYVSAHTYGSLDNNTNLGGTNPSDIIVIKFSSGNPGLKLETGPFDHYATYSSGSGSSTLTFKYTVQSADNSSDLDYVATNSLVLNSGTIKDLAGNNANLTLSSPGSTGSLGANKAIVLDSTIPKTISAGNETTCAVISDGTIKCWGNNGAGRLGIGSVVNQNEPVTVNSINNAIQVMAGYQHSCATLKDGSAKCWGWNNYYQLGDGGELGVSQPNQLTPVNVLNITTATSITAGEDFSCALLFGGTIQCWGKGEYGQLGNGTNDTVTSPVTVSNITNAIDFEAYTLNACAIIDNGSVTCWGYGGYGQLGDGVVVMTNGLAYKTNTPVAVSNITNASNISMGHYHACALLDNGSVNCWGKGELGQLGNGTTSTSAVNTPVYVSDISTAISISAGYAHTCAILSGGTIKCWGGGAGGELGNGSTSNQSTPVSVSNVDNAVAISSGRSHTCALLSDRSIKCWGSGSAGLGNGSNSSSSTPVFVNGFGG